jgi:hypothetical protein
MLPHCSLKALTMSESRSRSGSGAWPPPVADVGVLDLRILIG